MRAEIVETRRELARLNADLSRLGQHGSQSGQTFGRKFKSAALTGVKEMAKGAASELGASLVRRLFDSGEKGGRSYGRGFRRAAKKEIDSLSSPTGGGMKLNIGALPIIGAGVLAATIASQVGSSLTRAFEQERLNISFNALSADGVGGSRIFESIRQDALRTGQEIAGMANTMQRFLGLGFAEEDALKLNRALLDISGSLGMTNSEAALLGSALAQVKAKGVASMEELRQQIAEKGVPVFQLLAQKLGITEAAVIDLVSSGKLGADTVIEAFMNMEGPLERFRGGADRAATTAGGMFERIKRHLEDLKMGFGAAMLPQLKPLFDDTIGFIERMKDEAKAFGEALGNAIGYARAMFQTLSFGEMLQLAALKLKEGLIEALNVAIRAGGALMTTFSDGTMGDALESAALRFKEIMLLTLAEVARGLESAMPDTAAGRRMALAFGAAGNRMEISGNIAGADRDRLEASRAGGPGFVESLKRAFREMPDALQLSPENRADLQELDIIIRRAQARAVAAQQPGETAIPSRSSGGVSGAAMPSPAGGLLAGGLANALSRISGGPSTILMTRQLEAMKNVHTAVKENVAATNSVASSVDKLARKIAVFS